MIINQEFKQAAFDKFRGQLLGKIHSLRQAMHELVSDSANESKSTAGDKHETSRAMMQIEMQNLGNNLKVLEEVLASTDRIGFNISNGGIIPGSIANIDDQLIYIIGPGSAEVVNNIKVNFISIGSPLGITLMNKKAGDTIEVNRVIKKIKAVL